MGLTDAIATALRPLRFRGKERAADLLVPRSRERRAVIYGAVFSLDTTDFIQRHMYAGSYEVNESSVVRRILRPGMTFVDVGANVGYYTALAAHLVGPTGAVLAFEPSDYAFPRLMSMIERNRLTAVHAVKCGLADVAGEKVLYGGVEQDLFQNHTATMVPNGNPNRTIVRTNTLDSVVDEMKVNRIDFLKVDVDGLELQVLQGASRTMAQGRISHIMLECSGPWLEAMHTGTQEIVEYLKTNGFSKFSRVGRSDNYLVSR